MSFKSEAQRKKFIALVAEGKMSQATLDTWERATDRMRLPPKAVPKKTGGKLKPLKSKIKVL